MKLTLILCDRPKLKLASYVPATAVTPLVAKHSPAISTSTSTSAFNSSTSSPSHSVEPSPSASAMNLALQQQQQLNTPPPPQQLFKILPRSSHRGNSSTSSSAGGDDDSKGRGRRELTLEEREAAYKEARERIFKSESASTSTEGDLLETTSSPSSTRVTTTSNSNGSLGAGITRPSSTGSTYSRSSNISSLMGSRPSPSVASDSGSSISLHSSFQSVAPSGYYSQGYPGQNPLGPPRFQAGGRGLGALRPSAPSFDPTGAGGGGDWGQATYYPTYNNEVNSGDYSNSQQYGIPNAAGAGNRAVSSSGSSEYEADWSRSQQTPRQSLHPYAYPQNQQQYHQQQQHDPRLVRPTPQNYAYAPPTQVQPQQPPIQITAPSPLPRHANWPSVTSAPPPPPPSYSQPPSPQETFYSRRAASSTNSSSPSWPPPQLPGTQPSLPSPSLSTSSGGSLSHRNQAQEYRTDSLPLPLPFAPKTTPTVDENGNGESPSAGYIMRFADGPTVQARSVSSVSSTNSSTGSMTSRTQATTASTGGSGSGPASLIGGVGSGLGRKVEGLKGHSNAASVVSSEEVLSVPSESEKGDAGETKEAGTGGADRAGKEGSPTNPLHPSLPAKPIWVTAAPPVERATLKSGGVSTLTNAAEVVVVAAPPAQARRTYSTVTSSNVAPQQQHYIPSAPPTDPISNPYHTPNDHYPSPSSTQLPTTITQQSFYPRNITPSASSSSSTTSTQWWDPTLLPPPPPPPPHPSEVYYHQPPHQQPHPHPQLTNPYAHQQQHSYPSFQPPPEQQYYPPPPPPPMDPYQRLGAGGVGVTEQKLMMLPSSSGGMGPGGDMRRPTPRSTELFDPNKPLPNSITGPGAVNHHSVSVGMGRSASASSKGRGRGREGDMGSGVEDLSRGTEGVRLV